MYRRYDYGRRRSSYALWGVVIAAVIAVMAVVFLVNTTGNNAVTASKLLLDSPVRSGQSIVFPEGDVTVLGSVGSGAEIVAGGSIHVYGTLRGRAWRASTATRAHLLPEDRGRAARDRRLLPDRRRHRRAPAQPAGAGLARRRHHENYPALN
jgi:hypothetical protein